LVALAIAALVATPSALAAPTPSQAIAELNLWRAQLGESAVSTTDVPAWDTGCQNHNNYEHLNNNTLAHPEVMGNPGYTPLGATAGPDSVLAYDFSAPRPTPDNALLPGPVWDSAVFHRVALLEPRLANVGFNSTTFPNGSDYTTFTCLWDQNGPSEKVPPFAIDNSLTTLGLTLYPSPANGAFDVPTTFPAGTEEPDPATDPRVAGATLGWLLNVEINGPWAQTGGGGIVFAHDVVATLEPNGTSTPVTTIVSECGPSGCANGDPGGTMFGPYMGGGFGIFPTQPLAPNTTYLATATGRVTDTTNPVMPVTYPFSMHWCFSTGPTYTPGGQCAPSTTGAALEPGVLPYHLTVAVTGSGSVSGTGISCPGSCSGSYPPGSAVTLTATPASRQKFVSWSGGACAPFTPSCTVTVSADTVVTATFSAATGVGGSAPTRGSLSVSRHGVKLALTISRGKNGKALKKVIVKLPGGLGFSSRTRSLRKGISVGGHLGFTARVSHGELTINLTGTTGQLQLTISSPAIGVSKALATKLGRKKRTSLTVTVRVTDAADTVSTLHFDFTLK
jgi:hypothetical protein